MCEYDRREYLRNTFFPGKVKVFMSTTESIRSMLELMPVEDQIQVYEFTKHLFASEELGESGRPFIPVTEEKVLNDLAMSRREITEGKGLDMKDALAILGRQHGFLTEV